MVVEMVSAMSLVVEEQCLTRYWDSLAIGVDVILIAGLKKTI
jgi:hypothetical protein